MPASEFRAPSVPLTFVAASLVIAMGAGLYLGARSAGFRADVFDGDPYPPPAAPTSAPDVDVDWGVMGRRVYASCAACHQAGGQGLPGVYPALDGSRWVDAPPEVVTRLVLQGFRSPTRPDGTRYRDTMPAWKRLSDRRIAAVLSYVRTSWSNDGDVITPEQVGEIRAATAARNEPQTTADLEAIWQEIAQDRGPRP